MYITPIQTPVVSKGAELTPTLPGAVGPKAAHAHAGLKQIHSKHAEIGPGQTQKSVRQLLDLKHKLHRCGRGRGPKRGRRARRQRMQRRLDQLTRQLMGRLGRMMRHHRKHGCGQADSTKSGTDFGFLNDPNLSMNDKVELFLQQIIKDSESKIEQLMKKYEDQGKTTGKSKIGKKIGSALIKVGTAVAAVVASVYGTPAAGMAVGAAGAALGKAVDSSGSSGASKSSSESDKRMTMLKIQKLQDHVKQMFDFFSTSRKKQSDLIGNIIRNMA